MNWAKLIEIIKDTPKLIVSIFVVSGTAILFEDYILNRLGLLEYKSLISAIWLLSLVFIFSYIFYAVWIWVTRQIKQITGVYKARKKLNNLSEKEKDILRFYFMNDTRAQSLNEDDATVNILVISNILYTSPFQASINNYRSYNINHFPWKYLQENLNKLAHQAHLNDKS